MKKILLLFICLFLTTACYDYQELSDMNIVNGIGVDFKDDEYIVNLEMVKRENIGYTVRTLEGIKNLNLQEYSVKKERIKIFQQKVRTGYYTKRVMEEIRKKMEEKNR